MTCIDLLDRAARGVGDKPALADDRVCLSSVELGRMANRIARALLREGSARVGEARE